MAKNPSYNPPNAGKPNYLKDDSNSYTNGLVNGAKSLYSVLSNLGYTNKELSAYTKQPESSYAKKAGYASRIATNVLAHAESAYIASIKASEFLMPQSYKFTSDLFSEFEEYLKRKKSAKKLLY